MKSYLLYKLKIVPYFFLMAFFNKSSFSASDLSLIHFVIMGSDVVKRLLKWLLVMILVVVAVLAAGCTDDGSTDSAETEQVQTTEVSIESFQFQPQNIRVSAGDTVTWTNNDSVAHTATADNGEFDSASLEPGMTFSHTFEQTGTYDYRCTIHPDMVGTITVG